MDPYMHFCIHIEKVEPLETLRALTLKRLIMLQLECRNLCAMLLIKALPHPW